MSWNPFAPKYKHSDPLVRLAAVKNITDQKVIYLLATTDPDLTVRKAAISKLANYQATATLLQLERNVDIIAFVLDLFTDQAIIAQLVCDQRLPLATRKKAADKLQDDRLLAQVVNHDNLECELAFSCLLRIGDESLLQQIVRTHKNPNNCLIAVKLITDQAALYRLLLDPDIDLDIKMEAVRGIADSALLLNALRAIDETTLRLKIAERYSKTPDADPAIWETIIQSDPYWKLRELAAQLLSNEQLLFEVAAHDQSWRVQEAAIAQISDQQLLKELAINTAMLMDSRLAAVQKINDPQQMLAVCLEQNDIEVSTIALELIDDPQMLYSLISSIEHPNIVKAAVRKLTDEGMIQAVAINPRIGWESRREAICMMHNATTLAQIATDDNTDIDLRRAAVWRLEAQNCLESIALAPENDWRLRLMAIKKLNSTSALQALSTAPQRKELRSAASARLAERLKTPPTPTQPPGGVLN